MDSKSIRFFLVIAEEENMSKAAERLHMSQPPLSRQLKLLEEEVAIIKECEKISATEQHLEKTERSIMIFLSFCFEE